MDYSILQPSSFSHQFFMDKNTRDKPDDQPEGKRQCKLSDKPAPESTKELAKKITTEDEHIPEPKTDEELTKEKAAKERLNDKFYDGDKSYPRWIIFHGQKIFLPPPWDDGQDYYSPREFRGMWPWQIRRKDEDKEIY